jgi:hypothetical protein
MGVIGGKKARQARCAPDSRIMAGRIVKASDSIRRAFWRFVAKRWANHDDTALTVVSWVLRCNGVIILLMPVLAPSAFLATISHEFDAGSSALLEFGLSMLDACVFVVWLLSGLGAIFFSFRPKP